MSNPIRCGVQYLSLRCAHAPRTVTLAPASVGFARPASILANASVQDFSVGKSTNEWPLQFPVPAVRGLLDAID
jgi:hypothetical protein